MESAPDSSLDVETHVPHRPPILGLDALLELSEGRGRARRHVTAGAPDVDAEGRLWEAALIEGIAQTAAAMHAKAARDRGRRVARGMLVALSRLDLLRLPRVGETLEYEVSLVRELDAISLVHGIARVSGETVAEGDFQFFTEEQR